MRFSFGSKFGAAFAAAPLFVSLHVSAQTPSSAKGQNDVAQSETAVLEHVTDGKEKARIVGSIADSIKQLNPAARILTCDHVIRYSDPAILGKDSSFAAICTFDFGGRYSRSYTAAVCDDMMIGKFTLGGGNGGNIDTDQDFRGYIALNCPPGG